MNIHVYLEVGSKRTFACALDWPGWSLSGRDEASALETLFNYSLRYAAAVRPARLGFEAPADVSAFEVVERLEGNATTDFGAPGRIPRADLLMKPVPADQRTLQRLQSVLKACWQTFDEAVADSKGKTLRTGPRGGGRDQQKIVEHVLGAELAYLSKLGGKATPDPDASLQSRLKECRKATLSGLESAFLGQIQPKGPRGGEHWPVRYFVRREAWHVLDHAWEIQDRLG